VLVVSEDSFVSKSLLIREEQIRIQDQFRELFGFAGMMQVLPKGSVVKSEAPVAPVRPVPDRAPQPAPVEAQKAVRTGPVDTSLEGRLARLNQARPARPAQVEGPPLDDVPLPDERGGGFGHGNGHGYGHPGEAPGFAARAAGGGEARAQGGAGARSNGAGATAGNQGTPANPAPRPVGDVLPDTILTERTREAAARRERLVADAREAAFTKEVLAVFGGTIEDIRILGDS
jgi:hypothetical protein